MKKITLILFISFFTFIVKAQNHAIEVADVTFKIGAVGGKEELWYAFKEGDQIIFSMKEKDGKDIKEIEIVEYPSNVKFQDFKASEISNKIIKVSKTGIYRFYFKNSALGGRYCKVNIQRIPKDSSNIAFNTNVVWKSIYDTTYISRTRQVLDGIETVYESIYSMNNSFVLNQRTHSSCISAPASCTKKVITLNYPEDTETLSIFVTPDQESAKQFNSMVQEGVRLGLKAGITYATGGTSVLIGGLLDTNFASKLITLPFKTSNKIDIFFTDYDNAQFWFNDSENRVESYPNMKFTNWLNLYRNFYIEKELPKNTVQMCLKNNNYTTSTQVSMEVVAVRKVKKYRQETYQEPKIKETKMPFLETE